VTFTVTRAGDTSVTSQVDYFVIGDTDSADFSGATTGTLTFAPGETSKPVTLLVAGDTVVEDDESFQLGLANARGATIAGGPAIGVILNDDRSATGSTFTLTTTTVSHPQSATGTTNFFFHVTRTGDTSVAATVNFTVTGSGDHPADTSDFPTSGGILGTNTITLPAGVTETDVQVTVAADPNPEPTETFTVHLTHTGNNAVVGATGTGIIVGSGAVSPPPPPPPPPPPGSGQVINSTTDFPGSNMMGTAGDDTLNAGRGSDTMTGGAGDDHFVFADRPWSPAEITDFTHGQDVIDLRGVFSGTGYAGSDPVADGKLTLLSDGADGTKVLMGSIYFLHLDHVAPGALTGSDWITH